MGCADYYAHAARVMRDDKGGHCIGNLVGQLFLHLWPTAPVVYEAREF
jgi:hypothetical protein